MRACAPGKMILSGEYAVVHGRPALALAIRRHVYADVSSTESGQLEVVFHDQAGEASMPMAALPGLYHRLREHHQRFLAGEMSIHHVLNGPIELISFAVAQVQQMIEHEIAGGLRIEFSSELPIRSGLGASAAYIAATLAGVASHAGYRWSTRSLYQWTLEVEKLQHGHSSGVDPFIVTHGGFVRFQHGEAVALSLPRKRIQQVMSGEAEAGTGECVAAVQKTFPAGHPVWDDFERVTRVIEQAIRVGDQDAMLEGVRENHRLLCQIGIVPERVQAFIREVEAAGGAAKVCGAGSIQGDHAGVLWVIGVDDIKPLCDAYGYGQNSVEPDGQGVVVQ